MVDEKVIVQQEVVQRAEMIGEWTEKGTKECVEDAIVFGATARQYLTLMIHKT